MKSTKTTKTYLIMEHYHGSHKYDDIYLEREKTPDGSGIWGCRVTVYYSGKDSVFAGPAEIYLPIHKDAMQVFRHEISRMKKRAS